MKEKLNYTCCICKCRTCERNNAEPVKYGDCCDICNMLFVIPARIAILQQNNKKEQNK